LLRERPVLTICNHAFCSKCLKGALQIHTHCPICLTYQSKPLYDNAGELLYDATFDESHSFVDEGSWNAEIARTRLKKEEDRDQSDLDDDDPEKYCPMCHDPYGMEEDSCVSTICNHPFCSKCLQGVFKIHPYCPICLTFQSEPLYDTEGELVYELKDDLSHSPVDKDSWNVEIAYEAMTEARRRQEEEEHNQRSKTHCPSCCRSYADLGQRPVSTTCDHYFCSKCLRRMLREGGYCEKCGEEQTEPLYDDKGKMLNLTGLKKTPLYDEESKDFETVGAQLRSQPGEDQ